MAAIDNTEPRNERVTHVRAAPYTTRKRLRETPSAPEASANGNSEWAAEARRKKDSQNWMTLDPPDDTPKEPGGHVVTQRRFAATPSDVPGGVPPRRLPAMALRRAAMDLRCLPPATAKAGRCCLAELEE